MSHGNFMPSRKRFALVGRLRRWGVVEWAAVIQAFTAVVLAFIAVALFQMTSEERAGETDRLASERLAAAVLLEGAQPVYDPTTQQIALTIRNRFDRPVVGDYVEMLPREFPENHYDAYFGAVAPGQTVELRFKLFKDSLTGTSLKNGTYEFWVTHRGLSGVEVTQGWAWQHFPPDTDDWRMTALRINPGVEGVPETEVLPQ